MFDKINNSCELLLSSQEKKNFEKKSVYFIVVGFQFLRKELKEMQ
jgi:hypothetical protein